MTLPENSSFDQDQAFCVALDTEDRRFGGTVQNHPTVAARKNILTLTLRPRAALVFAPSTAAEVLIKDSVLRLACVDAFVQYLPMAARFQHVCDYTVRGFRGTVSRCSYADSPTVPRTFH